MPLHPSQALRRRARAVRLLVVGLLTVGLIAALTGCAVGSGGGDDPQPTPSPPGPPATALPGPSNSGLARDPATDPALSTFYRQRPTWSDCKDGFECASVTVPVDWSAPGGATLSLALIRRRATGTKIGSLLENPGGPGASGVAYLRAAASTYGKAIRAAYDLVSWDPRGVGQSDPVQCLPNSALDAFYAEDATPDTPAEQTQYVDDNRAYVAACQAHTGELLRHLDTISTVKDMDVLRAALGDQVLSFFGSSYGTYLGAWYAQEFPWRVGRLVLDGAVDPSLSAAGYADGQALGFSRALRAYVDDCLTKTDCPLRGTRADAYAQLGQLVSRLDSQPLRTDQGRPLTQALFTTGVLQGMYAQQFWPAVTKALTQAFRGDGTTMLVLADSYLERDAKGRYSQILQVTGPIYCLDHPDDRTVAQIAASAVALQAKYPPFGDSFGWGALTCALWPYKGVVPAERLTALGAAPILVVGTTGDPATPYEWAQSLASQLSSGRLLTRTGQGHTGYGQGSRCTDQAIERYLVAGIPPAPNTICS